MRIAHAGRLLGLATVVGVFAAMAVAAGGRDGRLFDRPKDPQGETRADRPPAGQEGVRLRHRITATNPRLNRRVKGIVGNELSKTRQISCNLALTICLPVCKGYQVPIFFKAL